MSGLGFNSATCLRSALMWVDIDEDLEASVELGQIDPSRLPAAVAALTKVLEMTTNLLAAAEART